MGYGSGLPKYLPSLTWHCNPRVFDVVDRYPTDSVILDMGAGGRRIRPHIKNVDFVQTENTDYVSDVCNVNMTDGKVDLVVATGLLEHLESSDDFLKEAFRLLKSGGRIHIEVPFMQQYHDDPIDCRRYTVPGLKLHLEQHGFEVEDNGFHIGPTVAIATLNAYYASLLFEGESIISKVFSNLAFAVTALIWKPITYLDRFLQHKKVPTGWHLVFTQQR